MSPTGSCGFEANPQRDKNQGKEWRNKGNVSAPGALRIPLLVPRGTGNNSVPLGECARLKEKVLCGLKLMSI